MRKQKYQWTSDDDLRCISRLRGMLSGSPAEAYMDIVMIQIGMGWMWPTEPWIRATKVLRSLAVISDRVATALILGFVERLPRDVVEIPNAELEPLECRFERLMKARGLSAMDDEPVGDPEWDEVCARIMEMHNRLVVPFLRALGEPECAAIIERGRYAIEERRAWGETELFGVAMSDFSGFLAERERDHARKGPVLSAEDRQRRMELFEEFRKVRGVG